MYIGIATNALGYWVPAFAGTTSDDEEQTKWAASLDAPIAYCSDPPLLRQHLDEADAARDVAAEEDPVRIGRIDVDAARIGLGLGKRELDPLTGLGIEARDHVDLVLADPDVVVLLVDDDRIAAAVRGWRREDRHRVGLVIDLHELAGLPQRDPEITVGVAVHAARKGVPFVVGNLELVDFAGLGIDARHQVDLVLGEPDRAVTRD